MGVRKVGLIKAKVTMVWAPAPAQTTAPGGLCNFVAHALWLMCLTGKCLAHLETVVSTLQPHWQPISVALRSYTEKRKEGIFGPCFDRFELKSPMAHSC